MPQLIKHIDQIAREQQRDVLYLEFTHKPKPIWVLVGCVAVVLPMRITWGVT